MTDTPFAVTHICGETLLCSPSRVHQGEPTLLVLKRVCPVFTLDCLKPNVDNVLSSVCVRTNQVGYVFGKGGNTIADVKAKAGVSISTDVSPVDLARKSGVFLWSA